MLHRLQVTLLITQSRIHMYGNANCSIKQFKFRMPWVKWSDNRPFSHSHMPKLRRTCSSSSRSLAYYVWIMWLTYCIPVEMPGQLYSGMWWKQNFPLHMFQTVTECFRFIHSNQWKYVVISVFVALVSVVMCKSTKNFLLSCFWHW